MGRPRVAAAEATDRKRPRRGSGRRSRAGTATRARVSTPPRSMSSTARSRSAGTCQAGTPPAITPARRDRRVQAAPALLGQPDRRRQRVRVPGVGFGRDRLAAGRRDDRVELGPGAQAIRQGGSSAHRSVATTRQPAAASAATVAAPMPRAAPVTIATRGPGSGRAAQSWPLASSPAGTGCSTRTSAGPVVLPAILGPMAARAAPLLCVRSASPLAHFSTMISRSSFWWRA